MTARETAPSNSDQDMRRATINVWACPLCGYWREKKEGGIHMRYEGTGPGERHELRATAYSRVGLDEQGPTND